jgi:hypothetical protein
MEGEKRDISPKTAAAIALVFALIGVGLCVLGSYALIQAWTWGFPLVLLMFLGLAAFVVAWIIMLFYLFVCVMELRGLKPDDVFKDTTDST